MANNLRENTKPAFNFSFDSPDLRVRNKVKESIYSDDSDDETPARPALRPRGNGAQMASMGFGAPSQEEYSPFTKLGHDASVPAAGGSSLFGGTSTKATSGTSSLFGTAVMTTAPMKPVPDTGGTSLFGGKPATSLNGSSLFGAAPTTSVQAVSASLFQNASQPVSTFSSAFGTSTQVSSVPAAPGTSSLFTAATNPQAAPGSLFQNSLFRNVGQPVATNTQGDPVSLFQNSIFLNAGQSTVTSVPGFGGKALTDPIQAPPATSSLFKPTTPATAQATHANLFQNTLSQASQTVTPKGTATQESSVPTSTADAAKAMAQTEEARLFAAHMKLLDLGTSSQDVHEVSDTPLFTKKVLYHFEKHFNQYGFLAGMSNILEANAAMDVSNAGRSRLTDPRLFFNISAPSSAFICGSQGSGKSHTLSCLLENCLMKSDVSKLDSPLAGLLFHYDSFTSDIKGTPCEAAHISSNPNVKVRVLVSPTNIQTMKVSSFSHFLSNTSLIEKQRTYAGLNVTVEPLRIKQTDLNTKRMLDLMAVNQESRIPLYLHSITRILRDMRRTQQENNTSFNYREFKRQIDDCEMTKEQLLPLNQRLDTLESFMPQSQTSSNPRRGQDNGNDWSIKPGCLTIVDLSCPCVTAEAACSLFNMTLSLFLEQHTSVGRVIGLDEAHKVGRYLKP
jgi:hypothetical protein